MAKNYPVIKELPEYVKDISDTGECSTYLPTIATKAKTDEEIKIILRHIVAVIEFEISAESRNDAETAPANQVVLNTAYRAYFKILQQHGLSLSAAAALPQPNLLYREECDFQMLYAILLTDSAKVITNKKPENLLAVCTKALNGAVEEDCSSLLYILKALNLLLDKFPQLKPNIPLENIYHTMQSNRTGMRDESMQIFAKCCSSQKAFAFDYFQVIIQFWPWTNRYKFYLLSCILKHYKLEEFLSRMQRCADEFYAGLRLSLSHKSLLAASQFLVRALSAQNSEELLHLSANVLLHGTINEIKHFNSYWYARIEQKDRLYEVLKMQPELDQILECTSTKVGRRKGHEVINSANDLSSTVKAAESQTISLTGTAPTSTKTTTTEYFRSTLIFRLFSRQMLQMSKVQFYQLCNSLLTNCFQYDIETQILVYKFLVENLAIFANKDWLEFTLAFINEHKCVDNAQYRNEILAKIPLVINYAAKVFSKLNNDGKTTSKGAKRNETDLYTSNITHLEMSMSAGCSYWNNARNTEELVIGNSDDFSNRDESDLFHIQLFFKQLHLLIQTDMCSAIYQPKIFSLRLLDILLKSLYADNLEKNTKNCSLSHNRKLGHFLIERNIFEVEKLSADLFKLLNDPLGYDDALDLSLQLLRQIGYADVAKSACLCMEICKSCDVDECMLSGHYARVTVNCCKRIGRNDELFELLKFAGESLTHAIDGFRKDPLLVCKTQNHLFGYINVMAEIVQSDVCLNTAKQNEILEQLEQLLNIVLEFLNVCKADPMQAALDAAASFQDMDESLGILTRKSAHEAADYAEARRFLLMSFWLTLKSACDLATEIGCKHVGSAERNSTDTQVLSRCLRINVAVLTRCRHKGAIEAAGVSIGKLTKSITLLMPTTSEAYKLLENCVDLLYDNTKQVSVTRRGAGYSLMMLHIVKNEQQRTRPLLKRVMLKSAKLLHPNRTQCDVTSKQADNFDRLEALLLHYLGVLVRDTELRDALAAYYNDILLMTLKRIEHPDWSEFNAALQLFGALVPKIVGQILAKDFDADTANENLDITYDEIMRKLPTACDYIRNYFATATSDKEECKRSIGTRTAVLFLGFLSKVKYLPKAMAAAVSPFLESIRELMWHLLAHRCERVRTLAALCFVRSQDFSIQLPQALIGITKILEEVRNENFFMGLLSALEQGLARLKHESLHTNNVGYEQFLQTLRLSLANLELSTYQRKPFTMGKLLDICVMVGLSRECKVVNALLKMPFNSDDIGYDIWQQSLAKL